VKQVPATAAAGVRIAGRVLDLARGNGEVLTCL